MTLAGDPFVGVEPILRDSDGVVVPMGFGPGEHPGTVLYEASVEPGQGYLLEVIQPPSSVVVTFDTSVSVGPYLDAILGALRGFGQDMVAGREALRILPFDDEPVLPGWSDDPFEIEGAVATYVLRESSSGGEANLARAIEDLAPRRGARAVLIITDAASSSYQATADLWDELDTVRPLVFAVQTGGINERPAVAAAPHDVGLGRSHRRRVPLRTLESRHRGCLRSPGQLAAPAGRLPPELRHEPRRVTSARARPSRRSLAPLDESGSPRAVVTPDVAVELVLDTSGSMLKPIGGERRIDVAKRVLVGLIEKDLPGGIPVALRVFEDEPDSCETELAVPLGPLDRASMIATVLGRDVPRGVQTPLAAAISKVADDLASITGPRIVVVLSDGQESCGGDPEAAVKGLVDAGFDVRVNIVGLGLKDRADRRAMARLARLGGGAFFDAQGADELSEALARAISADYVVSDDGGTMMARGVVGGPPLELPPGTYDIAVRSQPEVRFDDVYVGSEQSVNLELPAPDRPESTDAEGQ